MKKFLSMLLALTLVLFAFTAFAETVNPDDIEDTMTAEDGKYELAFVTDVGQLKDKSFNQGTWNGVKAYAAPTACPTSTISPPTATRRPTMTAMTP